MMLKRYITYMLLLMLVFSCNPEKVGTVDPVDAPDMAGQRVAFASGIRTAKKGTKAVFTNQGEMNTEIGNYSYVDYIYENEEYIYSFDITMYRQGSDTPQGSARYNIAVDAGGDYATDGTLAVAAMADNDPLYWPDNSNAYGFTATAGNNPLGEDQQTAGDFFDNDLLFGYAFEPLWDNALGKSVDDIDALNYRTSREWYSANKSLNPSGNDSEWKKVPLYLKHQRCWVTIRLKAGKGVSRDLITYSATENGFTSKFFSYDGTGALAHEILPWRKAETIHYDADKNGPATDDGQTISLNAIVDPQNYLDTPASPIVEFVLNNSKYEFYPTNDSNYGVWFEGRDKELTGDDLAKFEAAEAAVQAYNLTAGKHLTITATLTTDRIVLITALLEDWEDVIMSSICDDYGLAGNPVEIKTTAELKDFLTNKNRPGNIGLISSSELFLGDDWPEDFDLKCMLNLAGATLHTSKRVFRNMEENSSILNGTIDIVGDDPVSSALCDVMKGSIEQINVTVAEGAYATKGGMVNINHGTIFDCRCDLPVTGSNGYIGGIAAESRRCEENLLLQPVIDQCVVNARVSASDLDAVAGIGGIAGYAENRVSRCEFSYGLTLLQQTDAKYGNIVHSTADDDTWMVDAFGNSWPTTYPNQIGKNSSHNANANTSALYRAVIDCQEELAALMGMIHEPGFRYQIASDFEVDSSWELGDEPAVVSPGDANKYNLNFELDGNGRTITTNGKRLFSHINGYFHDMVILCAQDVVSETRSDGTDMIAPFAYSVNRTTSDSGAARIENIKVRTAPGVVIRSSQPSGIISSAYNDAKIIDCEVLATLEVKFDADYSTPEAYRYAGGIAAVATDALFSGCQVHSGTTIAQDNGLAPGFDRHFQFRGGIVGGIIMQEGYTPGTTIDDCNSWFQYGTIRDLDSPAGALIGSTKYVDGAGQFRAGVILGVGGNWWKDTCKPAGDLATDAEYIKVLGRRNSVTPTEDIDF